MKDKKKKRMFTLFSRHETRHCNDINLYMYILMLNTEGNFLKKKDS